MKGIVYQIEHLYTGQSYVRRTVTPDRREYAHFHALRCGTHHCVKLQRAFNDWSESEFQFHILERLEPEDLQADPDHLRNLEQKWIDFLEPEYNTRAAKGK